jgi:hypothetical protein
MLFNLLSVYILLFGESYHIFGANWAVFLVLLSLLVKSFSFSKFQYFALFVVLVSSVYSIGSKNPYYVAQDLFLFLTFILGFDKNVNFHFFKKVLVFCLNILILKTAYIYFFPEGLVWGSGEFIDGNIFDFGVYKRIQIKGADAILMIFPAFFKINRVNYSNVLFFILLIFAGSRALLVYVLIVLIIQTKLSIGSFLKFLVIFISLFVLLFFIFDFGQRFKVDDGRGEKWRYLETAIVLLEVENSLIFGNGMGSGFYMPVASGSNLEDGLNLYSHNIFSWLLLKGGIFLILIFLVTVFKIMYILDWKDRLIIIAMLLLNVINNYFATFSGAFLFALYLNYIYENAKSKCGNPSYAIN